LLLTVAELVVVIVIATGAVARVLSPQATSKVVIRIINKIVRYFFSIFS